MLSLPGSQQRLSDPSRQSVSPSSLQDQLRSSGIGPLVRRAGKWLQDGTRRRIHLANRGDSELVEALSLEGLQTNSL
jgi:hypothetical protein